MSIDKKAMAHVNLILCVKSDHPFFFQPAILVHESGVMCQ